jgi:acetyl esterase/lipase
MKIILKNQNMKKVIFFSSLFIVCHNALQAQIPSSIKNFLSEGTVIYSDIAYAADTLIRHKLDIYIPQNTVKSPPLLIWIHGGGWTAGDKYRGVDIVKPTLKAILDNGFAVAAINYRYCTTDLFPAQIQDCNQAIDYLYKNSEKYHIDKNSIGVIGFSAGGHLASLVATSNNNKIKAFYANNKISRFKIRAAIDFFGPSDFIARIGSMLLDEGEKKSTSTALLGQQPLNRPDLAKFASPTTYVDKADPPFLIFHGDKDPQVPITLSKLFDSHLKLAHVQSEFVIVPGAGHGGEQFGSEEIINKILSFLNTHLK